MSTAIKGTDFKNVAVMDVHNVSGDFICAFSGPSIGEKPVNPTNEGIAFFRWKNPVSRPGESKAAAEVRYFDALNKAVGIDAVVVFGNYYRHDGAEVAAAVKEMDPKIKILHVAMGSDGADFAQFSDATAKYGSGHEGEALKQLLAYQRMLERKWICGQSRGLIQRATPISASLKSWPIVFRAAHQDPPGSQAKLYVTSNSGCRS